MRHLFACLICILLCGCTDTLATVVNAPSQQGDFTREADVAYGSMLRHKLDVFVPKQKQALGNPVLMFIHGGAWQTGSKAQYAFVAERYTDKGFIVIVPNYGLYPRVKFPEFADDVAQAIAWTSRNLRSYGGDPARLYVMGHSAGAHLGALVLSDERYLAAHGVSTKAVAAFAGLGGPYSFIPTDPQYVAIFGPPERYPLMQVDRFIDGTEPPMMLITGGADEDVERGNRDKLAAAITARGGTVETLEYPGVSHMGLLQGMSWIAGGPDVRSDTINFFSRHTRAARAPVR